MAESTGHDEQLGGAQRRVVVGEIDQGGDVRIGAGQLEREHGIMVSVGAGRLQHEGAGTAHRAPPNDVVPKAIAASASDTVHGPMTSCGSAVTVPRRSTPSPS